MLTKLTYQFQYEEKFFFAKKWRGCMEKVDLSSVKVVDAHTHPFTLEVNQENESSFLTKLSLSVVPNVFTSLEESKYKPLPNSNMWMQLVLRALSKKFNCEESIHEIVKHRNELTHDYSTYTKQLFEEVNLVAGIYDFGYPQPTLDAEKFSKATGIRIFKIHRIEVAMIEQLEHSTDFESFIANYRNDLKVNLQREEVLGLKSIIAYRSGLEIFEMNEKEAKEAYEEFSNNTRAAVKPLRDYCLHIAMEECELAQKVMHIHTGIGDGEVLMTKASPSFLLNMLRDEKYVNTKVHLVHGGYPWVEEAAFISSILPNVYLDISLQNPFAGHGVERIISQIFEFAPFDKVLYGSDAFTVPEMNWMGVKLFKECFERVLNDWVTKDYMSVEKAQEIGEMVLYKNFEKIYNIKL